MISFLRNALSSWIVLGLLALVMIAFIVTGIESPSMSGGGEDGGATIAKVDGDKISANDLLRRVQNQLQALRREQPNLDQKAFVAGGGFEQVADGMIDASAVEAWGQAQGFAISKRMVDAQLAEMPAFRNVTGQFDEAAMRAALAQARVSEKELRGDLAGQLIRNQILTPAAALTPVPGKLARSYAQLLLELREGSVGIIPYAAVADLRLPSDAEIVTAYKARIAAYTRPEARLLRYALFGADQIAAKATPSEAEIAEYYRDHADLYAAHETRSLTQVIIRDEAAAKSVAAAAKTGTPLAAAAAKAGVEATTQANQKKNDYGSAAGPTVADQVFAAPKGGVVGPIKGAFGWYVVKVDAVAGTPGRSLAQARNEIAALVAREKTQEALSNLAGNIQDAIDDGSSFAEIATANRLTVTETPALLSTGQAVDQPGWQAPPEVAALLKTGFEASSEDRPTVETIVPDQRFALLSVARVIPPTPLPLARVRDAVVRDIVTKRAEQRAKALGDKIVAAVGRGVPLAKAMADSGVRLPSPQPARARQLDIIQAQQSNQPIPAPLRALFAMQPGKARLIPGDRGAMFVVVLDKVQAGNLAQAPMLIGATQQDLVRSFTPELGQQFIRAIRDDAAVKVYPDAIAAAKRQFVGGQ